MPIRLLEYEAADARTYEALRESEAWYRRMVDTAIEGIWALGPDAATTFVNNAMAGMLGYSSEEMLGRPLSDFMFEEDVPDHLEKMRNRRRGLSEKYERRFRRQDGQEVWCLASATPLLDEAGRFLGSFAMLTDITQRKRAEDELRAERSIFVGGPTVVFKWEAAEGWPVEYVSPNVATQFGYAPEDLTSGKLPYSAIVHPDDLSRVGAEVTSYSKQGASSFEQLYRIIRSDGASRWIHDFTTIIRGRDGSITHYLGYVVDITERKRAERTVALLSFALNNVREEAFLIDEHGRFQYVNEESCRVLGYSRDELLGMGVADVDPDFPESRWPSHWEQLQAEGALTFEGLHKARDGRVFPVEINANYFEFDGQGYNMALVRDITERKRSERERELLLEDVQRERSLLGVVLDTAPVGISVYLAPDGYPRFFNKAAERILGRPVGSPEMSIAERAGFHDLRLPGGEPFPAEELPLTRSLRGEMITGVELLVRQPTGREVSIVENSAPIRDAEGRIAGAVIAFQDITPIREQERLREEFIAAAAHELKTPVTAIRFSAEALRRWAPEGREGREARAIEVINAQTHRIARRVREMLEVVQSRNAPAALPRSRFDLGELAEHVVERMQALTTNHRMSLRRQGAIPVEADRERLQEVLASLLDNAIELSPRGGDVEVRVWSQQGEALVSVRDQGVGIPKERQPHVFEPFYAAIPPGSPGYRSVVNLSLYLSWLTIGQHQGRIWLESDEGKGSTFYFSLPLAKRGEEDLLAPAEGGSRITSGPG